MRQGHHFVKQNAKHRVALGSEYYFCQSTNTKTEVQISFKSPLIPFLVLNWALEKIMQHIPRVVRFAADFLKLQAKARTAAVTAVCSIVAWEAGKWVVRRARAPSRKRGVGNGQDDADVPWLGIPMKQLQHKSWRQRLLESICNTVQSQPVPRASHVHFVRRRAHSLGKDKSELRSSNVTDNQAQAATARHCRDPHFLCNFMNAEFAQCQVYDSASPDAILLGSAYLVSQRVRQHLPRTHQLCIEPLDLTSFTFPGLPRLLEEQLLQAYPPLFVCYPPVVGEV